LNQERLLFEARGLLVIDASRFAEEAFLRHYASERSGVALEPLRPGAGSLFAAAPEALAALVRHFEAQGQPCRAVRFEPETLPALLVFPPAHDRMRKVQAALDDGSVAGPIAELMRAFLERGEAQAPGGPVLHLNAKSGLLLDLERRGPRDRAFAPALELLLQSARFFAGREMSAAESRAAFERAMAALAVLLGA
jgi:hypothetical protein